jgi:hypothetical protein
MQRLYHKTAPLPVRARKNPELARVIDKVYFKTVQHEDTEETTKFNKNKLKTRVTEIEYDFFNKSE